MKKVRIVLLLSTLLLLAVFVSNCSVTLGWPWSWLGGPWAVTFDWGFLLGESRGEVTTAELNFSNGQFTIDGNVHNFTYNVDKDGKIEILVGNKVLKGEINKVSPQMKGTVVSDSNPWTATKVE